MRILYLDIDTLRADHLGCYGYHRNTSPNMDRVAAEGMRFTNYYCSDAPCLPSRSALMSGQFGIHSGVVNHSGLCADVRPDGKGRGFHSSTENYLPAMLMKQGMHTTYIGSFPWRHSTWQFLAGFRESHDPGRGGNESAEEITPTALDWIERKAAEDDWFLYVHYWDPHTPFRAPEDFGTPFENDPLPEWCSQELIDEHRKLAGPHTIQDISMYDNHTSPKFPRQPGEVRDMDEMRRLIDGYDTGIRYADHHFGQLLDALEKQGVLDDLIIIISADHGENYGELGVYAEHATADHATCRIPMIVRWPGMKQGVDDGLHYNLDLLPTLAELLNFPVSDLWDGQSYAPVLTEGRDSGRDHLVVSQCAHVCQRAVRWDDYIWIRTWHDGFHLFDDQMLFDLKEDPRESNNLAPVRPELCEKAQAKYDEWHAKMMESMPEGWGDPMDTVLAEGGPCHARGMIQETGYDRRLCETGRGDALSELKNRHPQEFTG